MTLEEELELVEETNELYNALTDIEKRAVHRRFYKTYRHDDGGYRGEYWSLKENFRNAVSSTWLKRTCLEFLNLREANNGQRY